jgi:CHAT domain-containing protein
MMASVLPGVALGALVGLAGATRVPPTPQSVKAPDAISGCDELEREWPAEKATIYCYFKYAREHLRWRETVDRLEQLRRTRPPNPLLLDALAQLYEMGFGQPRVDLRLQAAELYARAGDHAEEAAMLTGLADMLVGLGRFSEGAATLERAARAAEASQDETRLATVRVWRAKHALALEDYGRAATLLRAEKASAYYAKAPPWFHWAVLNNLARSLSALGRHREAFDLQRKRVEETASIPYMQAAARHGVAVEAALLADAGELSDAEADRLIREALAAEIQTGNRSYVDAGELHTRVLLARRLGATQESLELLQGALDAKKDDFDASGPELAAVFRLLARLRMDEGRRNAAEALRLAEAALAASRSVGAHDGEAAGLLARADVRLRDGARAEGVQDALAALDVLERIRARQPEEMVRAFAGAERAWAFELVAGWLLDPARGGSPADVQASLSVLERLRAATLVEALDAGRPELPASAQAAREREREAQQRVVASQRALLRPDLRGEPRARERTVLEEAEREADAARDELARLLPPSRARAQPPGLAELQSALAPNEALLSFQVFARRSTGDAPYDDGSSWVVAVSRSAARAFRLPDAAELATAVSFFPALVARRDGSERAGAARLYAGLLAAPLEWLGPGTTRLVLVPDGPLQVLPFEALRATADGPPLASRFEIATEPSAGLWLRFRRAMRAPAQQPVLALADASLPWGRAEALAAVDALGGGTALLGADASEHALKRLDLRSYGLIHFAAHAVVDDEKPERTAVRLPPGAAEEDGLLQMREVSALDLSGRPVVLAACSSTQGTVLPGEGVLGLGRAFFQAGASAVLGSLWPLRDEEAAAFFSAFYRRLGEGATMGAALAHARRERIEAGEPAAAWAGYVLLGDDSLTLAPRSAARRVSGARAAIGAALAAALLAAALVFRARWKTAA